MNEVYRELFDQATYGMVVVDLQGCLSAVNAAAARMLGRRSLDLNGTSFLDFLPPQQVMGFLEKLALLPSLSRFQVEMPLHQAQVGAVLLDAGYLRWKDEPAALIFLRETSVSEETERSLGLALQVLMALAGQMRSAFFLLQSDGRIERLPEPGPGMEYPPESPAWAWRVLHREEIRALLPRVWNGERVRPDPQWYMPGEGEKPEARANAETTAQLLQLDFLPLRLRDEPISRVLVVVRDCTDMELSKEREISRDRDAALALFSGALFQELNAYLGVILAQASALRLSAAPGRLAPPAVGSILDAAQEAASVLRRCSEAGAEDGWTGTNLNPCITDVARMLSCELSGVAVETVLDAGIPPVRGSGVLLRTMVLAIARHAASQMPAGGSIRLETRSVSGSTPVVPTGVELTIADTSLGVTRDFASEAGESIFPSGGGGSVEPLSLTFARAIVQRHRGQCAVSSIPGQGTTWKISLPGLEQRPSLTGPLPRLGRLPAGESVERPHLDGFSAEEQEHVESDVVAARPGAAQVSPRLRVLLADDEDNILQAGKETLRQAGYDPVIAADGQEAFERFHRDPASFALVILDAYMPRLGGLEAYLRMQAVRSDLPVLFVSGFVRGASRAALMNACPGRAQVLLKPFTDTDLLAAVKSLIGSNVE